MVSRPPQRPGLFHYRGGIRKLYPQRRRGFRPYIACQPQLEAVKEVSMSGDTTLPALPPKYHPVVLGWSRRLPARTS